MWPNKCIVPLEKTRPRVLHLFGHQTNAMIYRLRLFSRFSFMIYVFTLMAFAKLKCNTKKLSCNSSIIFQLTYSPVFRQIAVGLDISWTVHCIIMHIKRFIWSGKRLTNKTPTVHNNARDKHVIAKINELKMRSQNCLLLLLTKDHIWMTLLLSLLAWHTCNREHKSQFTHRFYFHSSVFQMLCFALYSFHFWLLCFFPMDTNLFSTWCQVRPFSTMTDW